MDASQVDKQPTQFGAALSVPDDRRSPSASRARGDTLPRAQSPRIGIERRTSVNNSFNYPQSELLSVQEGLGIHKAGRISRDFEQVIIDDDKSATGDHVITFKESLSPTVPRRSTGRRSQNPNRSRDSSTSSSSTDNSVDAFADTRRRERANTVESRAPSIHELGIQRTLSGGTQHHRPTLSTTSARDLNSKDDRDSVHQDLPKEEEYLPEPEEPKKHPVIDFEELDEFVLEVQNKRNASVVSKFGRASSFTSQTSQPRLFDDLRSQMPKIIADPPTNEIDAKPGVVSDSDEVLNEKDQIFAGIRASKENLRPVDPSRYSFFSSELEQTVHAADFVDLLSPGETWHDLFELPEDSGAWWLDVLNPTEDELHVFQRAFSIHRLTTEDIMTHENREKVELFKNYYFVCFKSFQEPDNEASEDYMLPVNVYMIVFREGIITITHQQAPHASNVRQRIGKLRDYMSLTADWICYAMIDNIVDCFAPPLQKLEIECDTIEDSVFRSREDDAEDLLRQIGYCRKKVTTIVRLLGGKADVIKGFAKRCNEQYNVTPRGEIGLYLGDIQDHVITMTSNLGHYENMLARSHSNYLATLSVDHIRQGNRANEVLSKITLLASILVPLNLICGLFGMNVPVPGKDSTGVGWFFGILGVIFLFVAVSLVFARRYKFI